MSILLFFQRTERRGVFFPGKLINATYRAPAEAGREVPQEQFIIVVGSLRTKTSLDVELSLKGVISVSSHVQPAKVHLHCRTRVDNFISDDTWF